MKSSNDKEGHEVEKRKFVLDEALKSYNFIKVKTLWIPLKDPLATHQSKTTNYGLDLSDKHAAFC